MQMNLFEKEQRQLIERDNIKILDVGPQGIQWRGADIPKPNSMFENDHTAQFGFSCASCGGSGINQDPVIHTKNCKRRKHDE